MFDELLIAQFDVAFLRACGIAWPEAEQHMRHVEHRLRWEKLKQDIELMKFRVTPPMLVAKDLTTFEYAASITDNMVRRLSSSLLLSYCDSSRMSV
jgi:hypothetical protein